MSLCKILCVCVCMCVCVEREVFTCVEVRLGCRWWIDMGEIRCNCTRLRSNDTSHLHGSGVIIYIAVHHWCWQVKWYRLYHVCSWLIYCCAIYRHYRYDW